MNFDTCNKVYNFQNFNDKEIGTKEDKVTGSKKKIIYL
jgi:hypothetical protein